MAVVCPLFGATRKIQIRKWIVVVSRQRQTRRCSCAGAGTWCRSDYTPHSSLIGRYHTLTASSSVVEGPTKEDNIAPSELFEDLCWRRSISKRFFRNFALVVLATSLLPSVSSSQPPAAPKLSVNWSKTIRVSKTVPTLQVVVNPPLRRDTPIHDEAFRALHDLQSDFVRYVPWLPYPKLGVAELDPLVNGRTS